ncbi:MAG: AAA family ATPase [Bacteroidia bacterium]
MFTETNIMEHIIEKYIKQVSSLKFPFERSALKFFDEDHRLLGLKGPRGTGKTTLLLQYARMQPEWRTKVLYVSLDNFWFATNTLYSLADDFLKRDGCLLLLDEVHKYSGWAQELKNIYDDLPELKVIFTGSSLLEILNARADLSRRAVVFNLQGLSFREYLALQHKVKIPALTLPEILEHHAEIATDILEKVKPLAHFQHYLQKGYYPFFKESEKLYYHKLEEVANLILEIELPQLRHLDLGYVPKIKQLLAVIAQSSPFIPNISKLSERIGINRTTLLQYVHHLEDAGLLTNLYRKSQGISQLQKPNKIFLDNTNLSFMLFSNTDKGALRETFFANQVRFREQLNFPATGDFLVNGQHIFEVGGKSKTTRQIKGVKNGFRALDDLEYGSGRTIPLWMFGFLY